MCFWKTDRVLQGMVQTRSRSAHGSWDLDTRWLQNNTKLSGNPGRAGEKVKEDTKVIEICISGNTEGRQFEEDSNDKKITKKGETQLKKTIKEPKQHEIAFYSLSETPKFALK